MIPVELDFTPESTGPLHVAPDAQRTLADALLTTMASIRRSARLLARRPLVLSTLTGSQVDLVRLLRRRPGVSVAQAAEELHLAPNTVSTLVRQLTGGGLVVRTVDANDRRVAHLELAPDMRQKVDAFRDRRISALSTAIDRLDADDRVRLADAVALLGELAAQLPLQAVLDE